MSNIINIGFNCSNEYAYITGVAIASILKNASTEDEFNIIILHKDIPEYKQELIKQLNTIKECNIEFRTINHNVFEDYNKLGNAGGYEFSNYRLKLASMCPDIDKILFLDSDVLVTDSLLELWNTDITNYHMACAADCASKIQYEYTIQDKDKFPLRGFNTGVMLCNLQKWRKDHSEVNIKECYKWYISKYRNWPDQKALNMAFKDSTLEVNAKYNCMAPAYMQGLCDIPEIIENSLKNPVIIHYAGVWERPWITPGAYYCAQWWHIARLTPFYEALLSYAADYKGLNMLKDLCNKLSLRENSRWIYFQKYLFKFLITIIPYSGFKEKYKKYKNKSQILYCLKNNINHCNNYRHYY